MWRQILFLSLSYLSLLLLFLPRFLLLFLCLKIPFLSLSTESPLSLSLSLSSLSLSLSHGGNFLSELLSVPLCPIDFSLQRTIILPHRIYSLSEILSFSSSPLSSPPFRIESFRFRKLLRRRIFWLLPME
jgi:hypothetical protein